MCNQNIFFLTDDECENVVGIFNVPSDCTQYKLCSYDCGNEHVCAVVKSCPFSLHFDPVKGKFICQPIFKHTCQIICQNIYMCQFIDLQNKFFFSISH